MVVTREAADNSSPAPPDDDGPRHDVRLVPAAVAIWFGTLAGLTASGLVIVVVIAVVLAWSVIARVVVPNTAAPTIRGGTGSGPDGVAHQRRAHLVMALALLAGAAGGMAKALPVRDGPVADLAGDRAYVEAEAVVTADPRRRVPTHAGDAASAGMVTVHVRIETISGRGTVLDVATPALVTATDGAWLTLRPGQPITVSGRLAPSDGGAIAAFLRAEGTPEVRGPPSWASRMTEPLRHGLREAVAGLAPEPRGLIPGLVIGDESLLPEQVRQDMTTTSLTHLTAVSGTNVTIILVVAMGLARWCGVRGRALPVLGLAAIVGFVLLARPEPSVIRAAVMGAVAVIGLVVAGRRRGLSALATAVIVLLLADPWLARAPGFAMSVLATGGILVFVPRWQQAMSWLPPWLATALAVPIAAQAACTPVLVTLSDEISLVSVPANLLAAPLVAPATVLGVAAAAVAPVWSAGAVACAWLAGWPAGGIAWIAAWGSALPRSTMPWPAGATGVVVALVAVAGLVGLLPWVLGRPVVSATVAIGVVALIVVVPSPGWPPLAWIVVACDVGQGDAMVLRVDSASAVVIDTGADPRAVQRCLDSLEITDVPMLVLTHFDGDHVLGTPGVLADRTVGRAVVSPVVEPDANAANVTTWLREAGVPIEVATAGTRYAVGPDVRLTVLWPQRLVTAGASMPNDASVVVLAEVHGVDVLLTGDLGPLAQSALLGVAPDVDVDVLKVPHHGSPRQDERLLTGVGADVALIGVGADNTYGHPAPWVIDVLERSGQLVVRTDLDGTVAVVHIRPGALGVVRRGRQAGIKSAGPP